MANVFLTAEWKKLAMANYSIDPTLLKPYLPYKTEIDFWDNTCYVSLVGFMFLNTKISGLKIPFHTNFEEVNLRFYVRYNDSGKWKRGVVFIKEIVPRAAITLIARYIYKENYQTMAMNHSWKRTNDSLIVEYQWKKRLWNSFKITASPAETQIAEESEAEFITEHFWGYTKISDKKSAEYEVVHPRWSLYPVVNYAIDVDFGNLYGKDFEYLEGQKPVSVFLAEGSDIAVKKGKGI